MQFKDEIDAVLSKLTPQEIRTLTQAMFDREYRNSASLSLTALVMVSAHLRFMGRADLAELSDKIADELTTMLEAAHGKGA